MQRAGRGLEEDGGQRGEGGGRAVHEARWVAGVLGEGAGGVAAIRGEGGAEEGFVTRAVEARVAGEEGVGGYGVVEGERGDVGAEGGDGTGCFVTFLEMGG